MAEWGNASQIACNGAWLVVWLIAQVVLWREPRSTFGGGGRKVLWAIGLAVLGVGIRGYWVPVGAVAFLARLAYSGMGSAAGRNGPKVNEGR